MWVSLLTRATGMAGVVVLAALLVAGPSMAFMSTTSTGAGAASTGTMTLTASAVAGANLYPAGSAAVTVTVTNTSPAAPLTVTTIVGNGVASVSGSKGSCDASVVTFTAASLPGTAIAHGASATYAGTVAMSAAASDGCQSGSFALPLLVTGQAG